MLPFLSTLPAYGLQPPTMRESLAARLRAGNIWSTRGPVRTRADRIFLCCLVSTYRFNCLLSSCIFALLPFHVVFVERARTYSYQSVDRALPCLGPITIHSLLCQ